MRRAFIILLFVLKGLSPVYAEQTNLVDIVEKEDNFVYKNATNRDNESLVLPKCASDKVIKRSFWLQSGIRKKELDNEFKANEINSSLETTTTTRTIGFDEYGNPLTETVVTQKPTQYTENVYRLRELQHERNSDNIVNGITGISTFVGLWRLLK